MNRCSVTGRSHAVYRKFNYLVLPLRNEFRKNLVGKLEIKDYYECECIQLKNRSTKNIRKGLPRKKVGYKVRIPPQRIVDLVRNYKESLS